MACGRFKEKNVKNIDGFLCGTVIQVMESFIQQNQDLDSRSLYSKLSQTSKMVLFTKIVSG